MLTAIGSPEACTPVHTRHVSDGVNELAFAVRVSQDAATQGWPQLILIVDGTELFSDEDEGIGADPWELTGDDSPLLTQSVREATMRVCDCGEAGCASLQVRVRHVEHRYVWDRWTGSLRVTAPLPTLTFDAEQYEAVVRTELRPRRPGGCP